MKSLLIAPVNTENFKHIIEQTMSGENPPAIEWQENQKVFYDDIEQIIKKHIFNN